MENFIYRGEKLREARFPMGGIGAGCVSIDGGARLVDWEIHNRPNKDSYNGFSHIAVKAERSGETLAARALNGPLQAPYMGRGLHAFGGYTYGPARETLCGVPHFDDIEMKGRFPVAEYSFAGDFPGKVSLKAWSPFEPNNDFDSSLPLALFEISIQNTGDQPLDYSVAFTLCNPAQARPVNRVSHTDEGWELLCDDGYHDAYSPAYGQVCVATDKGDVSVQQNWFRGTWFDGLNVFWQDFIRPGALRNRELPPADPSGTGGLVCQEHGVLCARVACAPGETARVRFALSWYYPNYEKYWGDTADQEKRPVWRNWYATRFSGASELARYAMREWDRMEKAADRFVDALYNSSMPHPVIDAAGATLSVLKSPTCLRLTDGSFYGWEGSHARDGSCEGSCQHVWNYQYALPMLFPALERSMRELDFAYNLQPNGAMPFRLQLPPGQPASRFRPCADGQMGAIIKTYREWKLSGDSAWLKKLWPSVRRALEYAWSMENPDRWDIAQCGALTGRQHQTLDMELFGPNSWLTGMYLAALTAASRMAQAMGESAFAEKCRAIREKGVSYVRENLFNGEYFIQQIDLSDKSILEAFDTGVQGGDAVSSYWNEEAGEIKYQVGEGSSIDQLLGQWHADLCGLGDVFDRAQVKSALQAIYRYNFVERMGERFNPCRIYCLQDESGLLICAYPEGKRRPQISVPYAEETMHGFEYAAACHMILRGMEKEGVRCVQAVRDRYDGERRNPWNEIECGGNYARSMAAWSLVSAYQGLTVDMTEESVAFAPILSDGRYRGVCSFGGAWGLLEADEKRLLIKCYSGKIKLRRVGLPGRAVEACLNGESLIFTVSDGGVCLNAPVTLSEGDRLTFAFGA